MSAHLADLVRDAERSARFGIEHVEHVYRQGRAALDAGDLGRLALHLRRIEPTWKLGSVESKRLARSLIQSGESIDRVCAMAQISRTTCWRLRTSENAQHVPNRPPEPAVQSAASVSNPAGAMDGTRAFVSGSRAPIVHIDATSGANW